MFSQASVILFTICLMAIGLLPSLVTALPVCILLQGGHGTGKTGNLVLTFSRQGKHREFCSDIGKNLLTQGKYLDCNY